MNKSTMLIPMNFKAYPLQPTHWTWKQGYPLSSYTGDKHQQRHVSEVV